MPDAEQPPLIPTFLLPLTLERVRFLGLWHLPSEGPTLVALRRGDPLLDALILLAALARRTAVVVEGGRWPRFLRSALSDQLRAVPFAQPGDREALARRREALEWAGHKLLEGGAVALVAGTGRAHSLEVEPLEDLVVQFLGLCAGSVARLTMLPARIDVIGGGLDKHEAMVTLGSALEAPGAGTALAGRLEQSLDGLAEARTDLKDLDVLAALLPLALERTGNEKVASRSVPLPRDFQQRVHDARLDRPLVVRRLLDAGRAYLDALSLVEGSPAILVPRRLLLNLALTVGGLPAALYGWAFHVVPCLAARVLAGNRGWSPAWRRLGWTAALIPFLYVVQGWGLLALLGFWRALACLMAAPAAGLWLLVWRPVARGFAEGLRIAFSRRLLKAPSSRLAVLRAETEVAMEPLLGLYS